MSIEKPAQAGFFVGRRWPAAAALSVFLMNPMRIAQVRRGRGSA
jgi:hypothetical protein